MFCCGQKAVWIDNGPRLQYWYCRDCKKEVGIEKEPEKSPKDDEYPLWGIGSVHHYSAPVPQPRHNWQNNAPLNSSNVNSICVLCGATWLSQLTYGETPCEGSKTGTTQVAQQQLANTPTTPTSATNVHSFDMGLSAGDGDMCIRPRCGVRFRDRHNVECPGPMPGTTPSQPTVSLSVPGVQSPPLYSNAQTVLKHLKDLYAEGDCKELIWQKRAPRR